MPLLKITFDDGIEEIHEFTSIIVNSKEDFVDLFGDNDDEELCSFNFSNIKLIEISTLKEQK